MQSNTSSQNSLSSENQHRTRKRIKKQNFKDKDGTYFENSDTSKEKDHHNFRKSLEEDKSGHSNYKQQSSSQIVSDSNNGYLSDNGTSNVSPRKNKRERRNLENHDDVQSVSSNKGKDKRLRLKVKKVDEEGVYHNILGLLQTDDHVKSIVKNEQLDYKIIRYEYNKKKHFLGNSASKTDLSKLDEEFNEVIDSMLEKFESLHLKGFESIKYLEEQHMIEDKNTTQEAIDRLRFMSAEEWENSLTDKDRRKIFKQTQDRRKVLRRVLETDLDLVSEQELYDEIKYRKSSKSSGKFLPNLRFSKSISAPQVNHNYTGVQHMSTDFSTSFSYSKNNMATPPMRRFGNSYGPEQQSSQYKPAPAFERNDSFFSRDSEYDSYRPNYRYNNSTQFLNQCSYTIDRKKMNDVADNVERYFDELPNNAKYSEVGAENDSNKLKDQSYYSSKDRHSSSSPKYNYEVLNELHSKIKSVDEASIEDLKLIIFLVQQSISDMKSDGRSGRGHNPKELLDLLKRLSNR